MAAKLPLGALSLSEAMPRPLPMELCRDIFRYVTSMRDFYNLSVLRRDLQPEAEFFVVFHMTCVRNVVGRLKGLF